MLTVFLLAVGTALFVSTLCSLCEAILLSLSIPQIELLCQRYPRQGQALKQFKENIEQPITAILTLNTLAHTIGASVAGAAAVSLFGQQGLVWFSLVFTLAILLLTEILPKTFGVSFAQKLAPYIVPPLSWMVFVLKPLILLIQLITRHVPHNGRPTRLSAEELKTIVSFSRKTGGIEANQETIIGNILQLGNKTVRQVMTPRTVTFSVSQLMTVQEAMKMEEKLRIHSRLPVYDGDTDNVVGIVLSQDIFQAAASGQENLRLATMLRPVHFVPETASLDRVFLDFFERYQHIFVVVDEYGSVTGVISMEDILEEIIGREIVDEFDKVRNMRELARIHRETLQKPET